MNTERIIKIIVTELNADKLKIEENLESTINSDTDAETKVVQIKTLMNKLVTTEASLIKFMSMMAKNNNEEKKD